MVDKRLARLAILNNGFPEILLIQQEVKKIKFTNDSIALKKVTTKTEKKIHQMIEYSNHTGLFLFNKIIYDYLDSCTGFFGYVKTLPNTITKKQSSTIFLKYKEIFTMDVSLVDKYISDEELINNMIKNPPTKEQVDEFGDLISLPETQLKNIFGEEGNEFEKFADRYYNEKAEGNGKITGDDSLDAIIRRKYSYTEGVGLHLKNIGDCPVKIVI